MLWPPNRFGCTLTLLPLSPLSRSSGGWSAELMFPLFSSCFDVLSFISRQPSCSLPLLNLDPFAWCEGFHGLSLRNLLCFPVQSMNSLVTLFSYTFSLLSPLSSPSFFQSFYLPLVISYCPLHFSSGGWSVEIIFPHISSFPLVQFNMIHSCGFPKLPKIRIFSNYFLLYISVWCSIFICSFTIGVGCPHFFHLQLKTNY